MPKSPLNDEWALPPAELLALLRSGSTPFALLHRPHRHDGDEIELLFGSVEHWERIQDIPLPADSDDEVLVAIPFRAISEKGLVCRDDGTPLLGLRVRERQHIAREAFLSVVGETEIRVREVEFDVSEDDYAKTVERVISDEIGSGKGASFVIRRNLHGVVEDHSTATSLAAFRNLVSSESGAYWTFLVHTGERTLIGASPEQHVAVQDGVARKTPISGTYRYSSSGPRVAELLEFLDDQKETDELYMVLDEELKMMASICDGGVRLHGPYLRQMARLAHTEYQLEGNTGRDLHDVLRRSMSASTVVGSPLSSACRAIAQYESGGRGYYSGALALINPAARGGPQLDSAILIRTALIDAAGRLEIAAGATLVRHSDPDSELQETKVKAAGVLGALGAELEPSAVRRPPLPGSPEPDLAERADVRAKLAARNTALSGFWLPSRTGPANTVAGLAGRVLLVDAEDDFVWMLRHQLEHLGIAVEVRPHDAASDPVGFDLVVLGPGPGNPLDELDPKMRALARLTGALLRGGTPFLSICLSHQILCSALGLEVTRKRHPNQGLTRKIDFFGRTEIVGFYNTFTAHSRSDVLSRRVREREVQVARDAADGEIHALRGRGFASVQFHPESVLTRRGADVLEDLVAGAVGAESD